MKIGIIGAMDEELISIRAILSNLEKLEKNNRIFWHGEDYGNKIFLTRCDPGKVNAVIATQQMIDHFAVDVIFNMGSSGALAPELEVGDLVVASEFIQHDFNVTDWGLKPGELMFDILMSNDTGQMQFRTQQVFKSHPHLTQLALEIEHLDEWWEKPVNLDFAYYPPNEMEGWLNEAGFDLEETIIRQPNPEVEVATQRAYLFARKPRATANT